MSDPRSVPAEFSDTLGLLTQLIGEIQTGKLAESDQVDCLVAEIKRRPNLAGLPTALLRTYNELAEALDGIRLTREVIQANAIEGLRDSHLRLNEVTSTAESATISLLDSLDRTLAMVDSLESDQAVNRSETVAELRDHLNGMFGHLQFQDIISQQLRGVMQLLSDIEDRIARVADLFDNALGVAPRPAGALAEEPSAASRDGSYNAEASARDADSRQAAIDETFRVSREPAAEEAA